ncbi:hypothetical protein NPIL_183631 [Nephila pilipes]|uniref:Uncharacterized protein n=1 Tax=Nephila pilipes TaxID=299642 RepID=A0A8X6JJT4_NEPPI|nr:hypothetical protein NPIL_183631 [Nephila pilipes]
MSLNKVGEEELLIHTSGSKVPTRIKCARVWVKFIEESKHILATACLDLRVWEHTSLKIGRDPSEPIPVLGLLWNKEEDNIFCDTTANVHPST